MSRAFKTMKFGYMMQAERQSRDTHTGNSEMRFYYFASKSCSLHTSSRVKMLNMHADQHHIFKMVLNY